MLKQRALSIAGYLDRERLAGYREIAQELGLTERAVRYDIDQINEELSLSGYDQIEKMSKGMLFVLDGLQLLASLEPDGLIFSSEQRQNLLLLTALFTIENLNITRFSDLLEVSRKTIQNDLAVITGRLEERELILSYERGFRLQENPDTAFWSRVELLAPHVPVLFRKEAGTRYEEMVRDIRKNALDEDRLSAVMDWEKRMIQDLQWQLSDESFQTYSAEILAFTWALLHHSSLPKARPKKEREIQMFLPDYEKAAGLRLEADQASLLASFAGHTNRYNYFDVSEELSSVETLSRQLIRRMEAELHLDFSQDGILRKGLNNHLYALVKRMHDAPSFKGSARNLIPEEYSYVGEALKRVIEPFTLLKDLSDNELVWLEMLFLGSIRRLQESRFLRIMLICGYGYGTTTVVKDALLNNFEVHVVKSISAYQVASYTDWDQIDAVVSTVNIQLPVRKPFAQVNVIFQKEDYVKLDLIGLRRRNALRSFLSIEKQLGFLREEDRTRVMDILRKELGFMGVKTASGSQGLSGLLHPEYIRLEKSLSHWEESLEITGSLLRLDGLIEGDYLESVRQNIRKQGFYFVTDGGFALLHGSENAGVNRSSMSLLITEEPVKFGTKQTHLIFLLASRDKKEHTPAVIRLARMIQDRAFLEQLIHAGTPEEAWSVIAAFDAKCEESGTGQAKMEQKENE